MGDLERWGAEHTLIRQATGHARARLWKAQSTVWSETDQARLRGSVEWRWGGYRGQSIGPTK